MTRILVIDDSRDTLEMLRVILQERGGYEVTLSNNGKDGIGKAISEHPDLAIIDVMMPEMTGYEVVARIRSNARIADLPIIILTARGQPVDKIAAMEAGADLHMSKPVDIEDLLEEISILLGADKQQGAGLLFPVFSLRGGIGTTTVAVNLALLLQQVKPTMLVDLSPNTGHCGICMGMKTYTHWGNFVTDGNLPLTELVQTHSTGLKLIPAPPKPLENETLSRQGAKKLLDNLRNTAPFIVADMPPTLTATAQLLLEESQRIILLSGDDPPGIQTTRQTLQILKAYREKTLLVLNTVTPAPHPPKDALQRALSVPIAAQLPYESAQVKAIHTNKPLVISAPKSQFSDILKKITRQLLA